jgi:hypothetical protein
MYTAPPPLVDELRHIFRHAKKTRTPISSEVEVKFMKLIFRTASGDEHPDQGMSMKRFMARLYIKVWLDPQREGESIGIAPALLFLDELVHDARARPPIAPNPRTHLQSPESSSSALQPRKRQRTNTVRESQAQPSGGNGASFGAIENDSPSADSSSSGAFDSARTETRPRKRNKSSQPIQK